MHAMKRVLPLVLVLVHCTPTEPPGAVPSPAANAATSHPDASAPAAHTPDAEAPAPIASAPAAPSDAATESLSATDGTAAQTEERPQPGDALTEARARALFEALVHDEPERGQVFFFPLDAYKQVKDSSAPESDWRHRLIAAYGRDLHEIHRARPHLKDATFVGLEIPETGVKWIKPGEEYNKIGYFRVFKSQLVYTTASGERKTIELKSLISWRGKFFLVHLSSFK